MECYIVLIGRFQTRNITYKIELTKLFKNTDEIQSRFI